ncbi:MAG TPA: CinA family protein [Anditalea sp.]|nr:CinA family protein [Anditalea sp.]
MEGKTIADNKDIKNALDTIKLFCKSNKETLSVAESATSGAIQLLFSSEEEAGLFFEGGLTVYSLEQKESILGIPKEITEPCHGVSSEVAEKLAKNICGLFKTNIGMGLTGFASTFPEQGIYDLYAYGAAYRNGELIFCEKIISDKETPDEKREDYAKIVIRKFAEFLKTKG